MSFEDKGERFDEFARLSNQKLCSYVTLMRDELSEEDRAIIREIVDDRLVEITEFHPDLERVKLELLSIT